MHVNRHHQSQEKLLLTTGINLFCSINYFEQIQGVNKKVNSVDWDMLLCNPSTGDYKILPNPCPSIKANYYEGKQLQGLGYCDDDYKIVRVIRNGKYLQIDVYALKNNLWKRTIEDVFKEMHILDSPNIRGTAVNGLIYWSDVYEYHDHRLSQNVLGFDLKNEKLIVLPVPFEGSCNKEAYLTVIEGYLGICHIKIIETPYIIVWKMREIDDEKKEWIKMITMSSQCGLRHLYPRRYNEPLCWLENGKILFHLEEWTTSLRAKFAVYDPKTGTLESYPINVIHWPVDDWVIYSESLVSPNA